MDFLDLRTIALRPRDLPLAALTLKNRFDSIDLTPMNKIRIAINSVMVWALLQLAGCAFLAPASLADASEEVAPAASVTAFSPWSLASVGSDKASAWQHFKLPGKQPSHFVYAREGARDAMAATAISSASMLRQVMRVEPAD